MLDISGILSPAPASTDRQQVDEMDGQELVVRLVEHLLQVLGSPRLKDEKLPADLSGINNIESLNSLVWGIRKLAISLSKGDLEFSTAEKGVVIGGLKSFQSNLKHLTWQAQQIAGGDYSHTVDFIGDFSEAFNHMTEQLSNRVTQLIDISEEYKDKSLKDPMTGLYNRDGFMHLAEKVFTQMRQSVSTLVIADIDKFKHFNDEHGHLCGDEVLKTFAACLSGILRPSDICSRYGGEEFLMLLPEISLPIGLSVAERLRAGVEKQAIHFEGKNLRITASFGVCAIGPRPEEMPLTDFIAEGIGRADANLYKAKESGRNRVIS